MAIMHVTSYNKKGEEIKTKDVMLENENVYKILRKYINLPNTDKINIVDTVNV